MWCPSRTYTQGPGLLLAWQWRSGQGRRENREDIPTQRRTTRNSSSGSPKAFSGLSSTFSRLPPEQCSITSTFCRLPPYRQDRAYGSAPEPEVPPHPSAAPNFQPDLIQIPQARIQEALSDWALIPSLLSRWSPYPSACSVCSGLCDWVSLSHPPPLMLRARGQAGPP